MLEMWSDQSIVSGLGGSAALLLLVGCFCTDAPKQERLSDCTNSVLQFQMTCQHSPPYQFVLGLPAQTTSGPISFRGEILLRQGTGTVARFLIGSHEMKSCNWLPGLDGYILTWQRTNRTERPSDLLTQGQTYDVEVMFSQLPPRDSSLWFSSMGTTGH